MALVVEVRARVDIIPVGLGELGCSELVTTGCRLNQTVRMGNPVIRMCSGLAGFKEALGIAKKRYHMSERQAVISVVPEKTISEMYAMGAFPLVAPADAHLA